MMKLLSFVSIYRKYNLSSLVWQSKKIILCSSFNHVFHNVNQYSVLAVSVPAFYTSFHTSASLFAKTFKEKENEYAHLIMSSINSYNNSILKYPLTLKNGPLDSNSTEISQVQELLEFSKEKEGTQSHHIIFVYGTLKRNEPNHDLITDSSKGKAIFEGMARTIQKFPLVIASRYNIPYLLYKEGVGKYVIGELYKVDEDMLQSMDELENNGKYYNRIKIEVQPFIPDRGDCVLPIEKPWVYFLVNFREHLLNLPHIENYSSKGPHGLEYVSRYNRPQGDYYYYEVQN